MGLLECWRGERRGVRVRGGGPGARGVADVHGRGRSALSRGQLAGPSVAWPQGRVCGARWLCSLAPVLSLACLPGPLKRLPMQHRQCS